MKNKPNVTKAVIQAISLLPANDSTILDFTSKGRAVKNMCFSTTNDFAYITKSYNKKYEDWANLKQDSNPTESTAKAITKAEQILYMYDLQLETLGELKDEAYKAHLNYFSKEYTIPVSAAETGYSSQEIHTDYEPKKK